MFRRPPRFSRTDTPLANTTLVRAHAIPVWTVYSRVRGGTIFKTSGRLVHQIAICRVAFDICGDEFALRHHFQPLVARGIERGAEQLARHPAPLDRLGHLGMREDDLPALALIGGDRAVTVDVEFEFLFGAVIAHGDRKSTRLKSSH